MADLGEQSTDKPDIKEGLTPDRLDRLQTHLGLAASNRLSLTHSATAWETAQAALLQTKQATTEARVVYGATSKAYELAISEGRKVFLDAVDQANASKEDQMNFIRLWLNFVSEDNTNGHPALGREILPHYQAAQALKPDAIALMKDHRYAGTPEVGTLFTIQSDPKIVRGYNPMLMIDTDVVSSYPHPFRGIATEDLEGYQNPVVLPIEELSDQLAIGRSDITEYLRTATEPDLKRNANTYNAIITLGLKEELRDVAVQLIETRAYFAILSALNLDPLNPQAIKDPEKHMQEVSTVITDIHTRSAHLFESVYDEIYLQIARKVSSGEDFNFVLLRAARFMEELRKEKTDDFTPLSVPSGNLDALEADIAQLKEIKRRLQNYPRNQAIRDAVATDAFPGETQHIDD